MGLLRFFLAISVATSHNGAFPPIIPADIAVQCFFVISGFYMSLVLNGKYADAGYWTFLTNRLLRLWPIYLVTLAATILLTARQWPALDAIGATYFWASLLTLFGQDGYVFLANDGGHLVFTTNFALFPHPLWTYNPVPQAWSLGVELWFYVLAPFILRRSIATLVVILLASLALRLQLQQLGFLGDPWTYRFFPSELALFLLGAVAQRAPWRITVAAALAAAAVVAFHRYASMLHAVPAAAIAATAIAAPLLFARLSSNQADKFIGELSYPIYILHLLTPQLIGGPRRALILTVVLAALAYLLIDRPIDKWRQDRLRLARLPGVARQSAG